MLVKNVKSDIHAHFEDAHNIVRGNGVPFRGFFQQKGINDDLRVAGSLL